MTYNLKTTKLCVQDCIQNNLTHIARHFLFEL